MTRYEILTQAKESRCQEVQGYQINIDNYTLAIPHIDDLRDDDLSQFREHLASLLLSERLEQKKAKVMLAVLTKQLEKL